MSQRNFILAALLALPLTASAQFSDNTPAFGRVRPSGLVHILDIVLRENMAYSGGAGGLWLIDISNLNAPVLRSTFNLGGRDVQVYGIALHGDYLYGFSRTGGVQIFNVARIDAPQKVGSYRFTNTDSYEHGVVVDNYLYIAAHEKGIEVADISSPAAPRHVTTLPAGNAFALASSGNYLFVAGGRAGFAVIDISNRAAPQLLATKTTSALAQDVVIAGNYAHLAVGSAGMDIFDVSNPAAPIFISNYHQDGFTNRLEVVNGLAYLANWETVEVVDVAAPATPRLLATQHAVQRAMAIAVRDNNFFVGDWAEFRIFGFTNTTAPDINAEPLELAFGTITPGSRQELPLTVENLGREPLNVTSVTATGSGFAIASANFTLPPFESRQLIAVYAPTTTERTSGFISIKSNDPDEAEKIIPLSGGNRTIGVGDSPTDFTLQDVHGASHHLQDYINQGMIIIMAFFASW
ncbi:MAG: hypothetical protein ONB46_24575 [candidate division KSB1 bacterium]|nr:hypothetical protein [candidate division KSB1 bacterium]MDZ7369031.1 hypothetical protein [candidate division KSB1 bacterium]MDZ7407045.1 hypothetical protein [candidate division KSB1 bacterium]